MTGWYSGPKWIISHSHSGLTYTKGIAWAVTAWKLHDTVIHNIVTYPQLAREGLNWRWCTYPMMHHFHVPQCTIFVTNWCIVWYLSVALSDDLWGVATHHVFVSTLTHWGRVTHICVGKLTIIGSDNGLSPGRRQAIIWTNAGILLIRTLGTNLSEILGKIHSFSLSKMHLKMSSAKWRLFGLGLNELNYRYMICDIYQVNIWIWKKGKWRAAEVDLVTRLVTRSSWLSKHFHSSVP